MEEYRVQLDSKPNKTVIVQLYLQTSVHDDIK